MLKQLFLVVIIGVSASIPMGDFTFGDIGHSYATTPFTKQAPTSTTTFLSEVLTSATTTAAPVTAPQTEPSKSDGVLNYRVENGYAVIISVETDFVGVVNIPATLGGYKVGEVLSGAFVNAPNITAFTVDENNPYYGIIDGVLYSGSGYSNLVAYPRGKSDSQFTIPSSVKTIDEYAFYGAKINFYTVPNGLTSVGNYAFAKSQICNIDLPLDVKTVGEYAFADCELLDKVYYWETTAVHITAIPDNNRKIHSYELGDSNYDRVVNIADVVYQKQALVGWTDKLIKPITSDVNSDGSVDILDVIELRRRLLDNG